MKLFDSHCHLEMGEFKADREAVIQRAFAAGVTRIVTVGTTLEDGYRAVAVAEGHPGSTPPSASIPTTSRASTPGHTTL